MPGSLLQCLAKVHGNSDDYVQVRLTVYRADSENVSNNYNFSSIQHSLFETGSDGVAIASL